jgi:anti-anti-sigma factor
MKISADKHEKYIVLKLEEEKLESLIAPDLKSELVYVNAAGYRNIILDLSDVKYVDSSGLSAVLTANRLCKAANGTFVMTNVQPTVKKLIEISQLDTILTILQNVEEAVDYVFIEEIERDLTQSNDANEDPQNATTT